MSSVGISVHYLRLLLGRLGLLVLALEVLDFFLRTLVLSGDFFAGVFGFTAPELLVELPLGLPNPALPLGFLPSFISSIKLSLR